VFQRPLLHYYARYAYYAAVGAVACRAAGILCRLLPSGTVTDFLLKCLICFFVPNAVYAALFYKTNEFKYLFGIAEQLAGKVLKRFKAVSRRNVSSGSS